MEYKNKFQRAADAKHERLEKAAANRKQELAD